MFHGTQSPPAHELTHARRTNRRNLLSRGFPAPSLHCNLRCYFLRWEKISVSDGGDGAKLDGFRANITYPYLYWN